MKTEDPDKVYTLNNSKVGANNKRQLVKFGRTINDSFYEHILAFLSLYTYRSEFLFITSKSNFLPTQVPKKADPV